jgi:hypothetical protein
LKMLTNQKVRARDEIHKCLSRTHEFIHFGE